MNALTVLFAGRLTSQAREPVYAGKSALSLSLERARSFPGTAKIVLLGREGEEYPGLGPQVETLVRPQWTKKSFLENLAALSQGFDLSYVAWADCPFLDPGLAGALAERHTRYAAEYSYADGWPYGFSPELLAPGVAGILLKILGDDDGPVERDCLFSVLQKDINAFDIETEISPVDLRQHRLNLCADSKRNLLLLTRFAEAGKGIPAARDAEGIIAGKPGLLRTLPNFFPIQVSGPCAQACPLCPYPQFSPSGPVTDRRDFMEPARFESLLEKIAAFAGDAVIDLSLWGELALHPQKMELIRMTVARPELALVIETSGIGWKTGDFEAALALASQAPAKRISPLPPLSWIVSLDTADPQSYREVRGPGFAEALAAAKSLLALFPENAYVQAVRTQGAEDDIEQFYRFWKEHAPRGGDNIIIQKYDDFCGALPKKQASDLSPVRRQPCWHIMRDLPVLIDGQVPLCREELAVLKGGPGRVLGNLFTEDPEEIWNRGRPFYDEQGRQNYRDLCAGCDEYYTYNF
jgi:spiro-SPASM protein